MVNRILILTDDPDDANALKGALRDSRDGPFDTEWVRELSAGLELIRVGDIYAILADLSLPDSQGVATFDQLFAVAPHTPIITLCAADQEGLATEAARRGAQGNLSKGDIRSTLVSQALRTAAQRTGVEEALYKEKTRAEITLNSITDAVICTDMSGKIDYMNDAAENITGWSKEEAQGRPFGEVFQIINGVTREPERNPVELVLQQDRPMGLNADTVLIRKDGSEAAIEDSASPIHDWSKRIAGAVIVFHDVSEARSMTEKMAHLAQHDFLTNLPNRILLNDRIAQAINLAKRHGTQLAVLFLDLDNFKNVNDSLGHEIGDKLLQSVAERLHACVRSSDTVSRQGGDEFVLLLTEGKHEKHAALTAEKILAAVSSPHSVAKHELTITTSIGLSVYPADGQDAETLIKGADTAMYYAKEKGKNNCQFFSSEMNALAVERQLIETNLRRALEKQEFALYYQAIVNLETSKITGVEALVRWMHPEWGIVLPERFVSIAEDCGLIVPIGRWILREACTQARRWRDAGLAPLPISVNISALEFVQKDFFEGVRGILNDTGMDAQCLQLEITEGVIMRDAESSTAILRELKNIGVRLAIDDFGTGYSSLSYLKQFPIDVLKIDQSFVNDIMAVVDGGIIVSAVIGMGNSLKKRVIAEGVENHAQLGFLKARHCEEGQGYLFSRPLVAEQFATLLASGISTTPIPMLRTAAAR